MKVELYFLCFKKHGALQHVVEGPFLTWCDAASCLQHKTEQNPKNRLVIATAELELKEIE